jgi:hypothetical protein
MIKHLKATYPDLDVIAGNVCSAFQVRCPIRNPSFFAIAAGQSCRSIICMLLNSPWTCLAVHILTSFPFLDCCVSPTRIQNIFNRMI